MHDVNVEAVEQTAAKAKNDRRLDAVDVRQDMRFSALARLGTVATVALTVCFAAAPALASTASEEQQGAALVKALNTGKSSCKSLASTDFERIGEYAMGLNFTTAAQHDAMNQRMRAMMGAQGEEQAHQAMGRAYSGCVPSGQKGTYGAGMMDGYGSSGSGMMGGSAYGPGMMNGNGRGANHDMSTAAVIVIAVLASALGAALFALLAPRIKRRGSSASTS